VGATQLGRSLSKVWAFAIDDGSLTFAFPALT
jgi:hypothetical protein